MKDIKFTKIIYGTAVAALGAVLLLLAASALPVGKSIDTHVLVVQTGSMEPELKPGDIVIVRPASGYAVGDIITFHAERGGEVPITHRIKEVTETDNGPVFLTKGDANASADMEQVTRDKILGKVSFTVPYIGRIVDYAETPLGFMLLVIIPIFAIIFSEIMKIINELKGLKKIKVKQKK